VAAWPRGGGTWLVRTALDIEYARMSSALFKRAQESDVKKIALVVFAVIFSFPIQAADESIEKPTQHLKIADVSSMEDAKEIFLENTLEIRNMKNIHLEEASKIHIITYTLEKSVAYFAENLTGEKQSLAKEMAVVVEDIHLSSENNRLEKLQGHLREYFDLVDEFIFCF
jgi:hypothetical protein